MTDKFLAHISKEYIHEFTSLVDMRYLNKDERKILKRELKKERINGPNPRTMILASQLEQAKIEEQTTKKHGKKRQNKKKPEKKQAPVKIESEKKEEAPKPAQIELLVEKKEEKKYIDFSKGEGKLTRAKKELKKALAEREKEEKLRAEDKKKADEYRLEKAIQKAALRAEGIKVHDNVGMLRQSVRSKQKQRRKSAMSIQAREKSVNEAMRERQEKREMNVKKRKELILLKRTAKRDRELIARSK